jgi:Fur family ferric uptake transcriptional regulator
VRAVLTYAEEERVTATDALRAAYRGRVSPQRLAIAAAADAMRAAFSAEDLATIVRDKGVATATVYRAVTAMQESGFIESVGSRDGATLFARCRADGHHHHLVCTGCGAVAEAGCDLGAALSTTANASGFTLTRHELTLYGLCAACTEPAEEGTQP